MIDVNGIEAARHAADKVIAAFEDCGRSPITIKQYKRVYRKFFDFLERESFQRVPTEGDCVAFINVSTGAGLKGLYDKSPDGETGRVRRPLALMQDYLRDGEVDILKVVSFQPWSCPRVFSEVYAAYVDSIRARGNARATIRTKEDLLGKFLDYLLESGIDELSRLSAKHVSGFLLTLAHCKRRTVIGAVGVLRDFLRFLEAEGVVEGEPSSMLPKGHVVRNDTVPYLWKAEEIAAILAVIDRASAIGKRDYAMILLVARLGLRTSDLRRLEASSIDWRAKTLTIVQHKTGVPLKLPLLDDVGWAIIDYLKNGRPETECSRIFVKHTYPFDELGEFGSVGSRLYKYADLAGIDLPRGQLHGMHSLRGSLARAMLANGTPVATISETLGHVDSNTTEAYYLRLDVENLRCCALDVEDVIGGAR